MHDEPIGQPSGSRPDSPLIIQSPENEHKKEVHMEREGTMFDTWKGKKKFQDGMLDLIEEDQQPDDKVDSNKVIAQDDLSQR